MHRKDLRRAGKPTAEASAAVIMLHGRGAPAEDIMGLASHLAVNNCALIAPQATNYTWYPGSFLAPPEHNEPWLTSALALIDGIVAELGAEGIPSEKIFFTGFSQGACLMLEYVTRHARQWAGVAAFTGGLIGDRIYADNYKGDFNGTRVFIGTGDPDPHVPVQRVRETTKVLSAMNALVKEQVYPGMGHTILEDEISLANEWVFESKAKQ